MKHYIAGAAVILAIISTSARCEVTLDQSVSSALKNNESVTIARKNLDAAKAKVMQAFSGYLPSLTVSSNYTRTYQSPITTDFNGVPVVFGIDQAADGKGWAAEMNQNIFTFGKLESGLGMALDGAKSAEQELRRAEHDVVYRARESYYNVIKANKMVTLAVQSLGMAQAHLDQVKAMLKAGMSTRADVLRSEVAVFQAQQELIKANNGREIARAAYNNVVGARIEDPVDIGAQEFPSPGLTEKYDYKTLLADAFKYRPEYLIANFSSDIAGNNLNMARSQWLPSLVAQGKYSWMDTDYSPMAIKYDARNWSVTAAASWTLFDGFDTAAKIKEAEAGMESARAGLSQAKKAVELDVKQAYLNYTAAKDTIESAKKSVESAQENNKIAGIRYKNGLATNIEILDAQTSLTKAEVDLLGARFDLELAKTQIARATGTLDKDIKHLPAASGLKTISGTVQYIDLEGGFPGFIDSEGKRYELSGAAASEIVREIKAAGKTKKIKVRAREAKGGVTFRMWGMPLEVASYEWQ